jgi:hypothetical protein
VSKLSGKIMAAAQLVVENTRKNCRYTLILFLNCCLINDIFSCVDMHSQM